MELLDPLERLDLRELRGRKDQQAVQEILDEMARKVELAQQDLLVLLAILDSLALLDKLVQQVHPEIKDWPVPLDLWEYLEILVSPVLLGLPVQLASPEVPEVQDSPELQELREPLVLKAIQVLLELRDRKAKKVQLDSRVNREDRDSLEQLDQLDSRAYKEIMANLVILEARVPRVLLETRVVLVNKDHKDLQVLRA